MNVPAAKKAIVIGASSGIGKALAMELARKGYAVGITSRRVELLTEIKNEIQGPCFVKQMDVTQTETARRQLLELIQEMGSADLIIVCAGIGFRMPIMDWNADKSTIDVNVCGFAALTNAAVNYFIEQKHGHVVGISSVAAIRGHGDAPAYGASKAFEASYLNSIRYKIRRLGLPIAVTNIQPGFVDTPMVRDARKFWTAPAEKAARQIVQAIEKKKKQAYITKRWRLVAWVMRIIPDGLWWRIR